MLSPLPPSFQPPSAWAALMFASFLAWKGRSLLQVAVSACGVVFVLELLMM